MNKKRWPGYWARHYRNRLRVASIKADAATTEVVLLRAQLALVTEADDRPLWRRIAAQRRAIKSETWWKSFWERRFHEEAKRFAEYRAATAELDLSRFTRVTVIAPDGGRAYENWDYKGIEIHEQDGGRTLKIFPAKPAE